MSGGDQDFCWQGAAAPSEVSSSIFVLKSLEGFPSLSFTPETGVAQPVLYLPQAAFVMLYPLKIPLQLPVLLPQGSASAQGEGRKLGRDKPHWRFVTPAGSHVPECWTKPPHPGHKP